MKILLWLLMIPAFCYSQQNGSKGISYAYAEYVHYGYGKSDVQIHFAADSILDYMANRKEKRIPVEEQLNHSFEVIDYMATQGYTVVNVSQNYDPSNQNMNHYTLLVFFRKDFHK
ncbi:MAG: hypothetical protein JSS76_02125 [Bacteroidetes bacterium]|nr:hypothetical protein [Bacteroidota bacterium]